MTDLQLDVKGCPDVYASFDKYVEVEHLDGNNKYHAEQYGLQVNRYAIERAAATAIGAWLIVDSHEQIGTPFANGHGSNTS
ncbi:Ubiquitin carboxyl-terminal hydrolase 12 [Sesamum angolense]|uniref:Ubiquitin carboxyl-terminal hydrolase 12 n=1 Tax=Sesamum angolense TaxID=2727404 RepID=A0AAE2C432_9LAMI|nr:Ubiquitin carboxyl-terminal hydrolase 12 [Sesamum angolense]